eukprot:Hpha_TRINITY_DN15267_c0_g1::TRINITY_DN15267_c0_g1_i3::g.67806::m.67806
MREEAEAERSKGEAEVGSMQEAHATALQQLQQELHEAQAATAAERSKGEAEVGSMQEAHATTLQQLQQKLHEAQEAVTAERSRGQDELGAAREELGTAKAAHAAELQQMREEAEAERSKGKAEVGSMQEAHATTLQQLRQELHEAQEAVSAARSQSEAGEKAHAAVEQQLRKELLEAQQETAVERSRGEERCAELGAMQESHVSEMHEKDAELASLRAEHKAATAALEGDIVETTERHSDAMREQQCATEALRKELENAREEHAAAEHRLAEKENESKALQHRTTENEHKVVETQEQLSAARAQASTTRMEEEERAARCKLMFEERARLMTKCGGSIASWVGRMVQEAIKREDRLKTYRRRLQDAKEKAIAGFNVVGEQAEALKEWRQWETAAEEEEKELLKLRRREEERTGVTVVVAEQAGRMAVESREHMGRQDAAAVLREGLLRQRYQQRLKRMEGKLQALRGSAHPSADDARREQEVARYRDDRQRLRRLLKAGTIALTSIDDTLEDSRSLPLHERWPAMVQFRQKMADALLAAAGPDADTSQSSPIAALDGSALRATKLTPDRKESVERWVADTPSPLVGKSPNTG